MSRASVLVLGLGNELFTDEGLGVAAARMVDEAGLPDVEVVDGGTLGLGLVPEIADREGVLILDAVVSEGRTPGDLVVLGRDDLIAPRVLLYSAHQIGVQEALTAAELAGQAPSHVAGIGMVPFSLETGYGLTDEARERLPRLRDAAFDVLAAWGIEVGINA